MNDNKKLSVLSAKKASGKPSTKDNNYPLSVLHHHQSVEKEEGYFSSYSQQTFNSGKVSQDGGMAGRGPPITHKAGSATQKSNEMGKSNLKWSSKLDAGKAVASRRTRSPLKANNCVETMCIGNKKYRIGSSSKTDRKKALKHRQSRSTALLSQDPAVKEMLRASPVPGSGKHPYSLRMHLESIVVTKQITIPPK